VRLQSGPWVGNLHATVHDVDHVFAGGLVPVGTAEVLERGRLSDHAPVRVSLAAP
jgi:endonuclease/exonuclease/phosphatase (EEP) superfamily protein YafD